MSKKNLPVLPGTVEFLALGGLVRGGQMHGFQILRWIRETTDGDLLLEEGALYPALHGMGKGGWRKGEWAVSEKGRRAKYYSVTGVGMKAFGDSSAEWNRYVSAVGRVVAEEAES